MQRLLLITLFVFVVVFINIKITRTEEAEVTESTQAVVIGNIVNEEEVVNEVDVVSEEPVVVINCKTYEVPSNKGFKSYMDYRAITSTSSYQFQLQKLYASTNDCGIRVVNDRYCIAVGTHFGAEIGQYLDLILENGTVIPCVLSDIKADIHTDENNIVTLHNGCVSEFIVDTSSLYNMSKLMGDVSYCYEEWRSPVVQVVVYEQNVFN